MLQSHSLPEEDSLFPIVTHDAPAVSGTAVGRQLWLLLSCDCSDPLSSACREQSHDGNTLQHADMFH